MNMNTAGYKNKLPLIVVLVLCSLAFGGYRWYKARTHLSFKAIDFDEGMAPGYLYDRTFAQHDANWLLLKKLYKQHLIDNLEMAPLPRIPKKIHWIWLGSPLPERSKACIKTWLDRHPDWQYKIWTDVDIPQFPWSSLKQKELFERASNWGEKSDILRLEVLYREGGIYVDHDFGCMRPIDALHHAVDFYAGVAYYKEAHLQNSLIAARPGHPIIKHYIDSIKRENDDNSFMGIINRTGPHRFTSCFFEGLSGCNDKVVVLPLIYFYPLPNRYFRSSNKEQLAKRFIKPETFCVHYWSCSWVQA